MTTGNSGIPTPSQPERPPYSAGKQRHCPASATAENVSRYTTMCEQQNLSHESSVWREIAQTIPSGRIFQLALGLQESSTLYKPEDLRTVESTAAQSGPVCCVALGYLLS